MLEVALEVGGGGGHSLSIKSASITAERMVKVLFANVAEGKTTAQITTLSGAVVAEVDFTGVPIEDLAWFGNHLRTQVSAVLPGVSFKILMAGGGTETLCSSFTPLSDLVGDSPSG